jgi:hypothetical protein
MRAMLIAALLAAAHAAGAAEAKPDAIAPRHVAFQAGPISALDVTNERDGSLVFRFAEPRVSYRMPAQSKARLEAVKQLLMAAKQERVSVTLHFDAATGRVDASSGTIGFTICAISVGERRAEMARPCPKDGPTSASGDRALALAYGLQQLHDPGSAARLLDAADGAGGPRKVMLWLRAQNRKDQAELEEPGTAAADRLYLQALQDYRELAGLEPSDPAHPASAALMLERLGAYAEADAVYDALLKGWPDLRFQLLMRKVELQRFAGSYSQALATLDGVAGEFGVPGGMAYRYHRGWILSLLERYEEAVTTYSEGLKSQPDYGSAYERRGCAEAALGRLGEAMADLDRARTLIKIRPGGDAAQALLRELDWLETARKRVAAAAGKPIPDLCRGAYWDGYDRPRPRSPLLPTS